MADRIGLWREGVRVLSLPMDNVDVVLSRLCLHTIDAREGRGAALRELVRVLTPGGLVVVADLAHLDEEYAALLRDLGLTVQLLGAVPRTFPRQRLMRATAPSAVPPGAMA